jgi:Uncharacterized protein conserved in bacteria
MQKFKNVVGLPVVCIENGKKVGRVGDIIFSSENKGVQALVLEKKGAEFCRKAIAVEDIVNLGDDAVIVNDVTCIKKIKKRDMRNSKGLHGLHIYTKDGRDLGVVKDIIFDYKNAVIEAFEISDGIISDVFTGRRIVPLFGKVEFGEDSILISDEALEEITTTGGGIKNRLK